MSRLFKERSEALFFIVEDNDSFAEIIISSMTMKALKKRCEELKARLQAREITSSSFIYSERSRSQKIPVESCFVCHKSGHSSKKCLDRPTRISAVNKEYDRFDFNSNFNSKN